MSDRSISIALKRKLPTEKIRRFQLKADGPKLLLLMRQCVRWAQDHAEKVQQATPTIPEFLNDRAADNWDPLLSIAETAGGGWLKKANKALLELEGGPQDETEEGVGIMLLIDIRAIFAANPTATELSSATIVTALEEMKERPWPEWRRGKPITQNAMARLLKPFRIDPKPIRRGTIVCKGYVLSEFNDVFARYIPQKHEHAQTQQAQDGNVSQPPACTTATSVTTEKNYSRIRKIWRRYDRYK